MSIYFFGNVQTQHGKFLENFFPGLLVWLCHEILTRSWNTMDEEILTRNIPCNHEVCMQTYSWGGSAPFRYTSANIKRPCSALALLQDPESSTILEAPLSIRDA